MTLSPSNDEAVRRIRRSQIREELLSPANALVQYAEIAYEEARNGTSSAWADFERILSASRELAGRIDGLVTEVAAGSGGESGPNFEQKLRHDLRTPLNAITGYGEMLLEDIAGAQHAPVWDDLSRVMTAAWDLLARLDEIVQFSAGADHLQGSASTMAAGLVQSLLRGGDHESSSLEPGYVLVVDDVAANRDMLSRRLTRDGCRVATAAGGLAALSALEREGFDLVLLDLMMPDMNGLDVLLRIKGDERLRHVPVIMITGLTEIDSAIRCIEAGAEDYLPKPFDPILLRARIRACLERKRWRDREHRYLLRLEEETARFERLLLSILPRQVIGRLNDGETLIADRYSEATVLFADLVGFTELSARTHPAAVVEFLTRLFSQFDASALTLGVEKIKTIGDAYMAVAGVPDQRADHCQAAALMALDMLERLSRVNEALGCDMKVRIGVHCGPVVAGIVGTHRSVYDVWGDTVNVASRLEGSSLPNRIHLSKDAADRLGSEFRLEPRGGIELRGRGPMQTFFLLGQVERA